MGRNGDLAPLKELLIRRTEGNPFFAEESVRSLVEAGVLVGEKAYRPGLRIDEIRIPSTVQTSWRIVSTGCLLKRNIFFRLPPLSESSSPRGFCRVQNCRKAIFKRYLAHLQAGEFLYESNLFPDSNTLKHALTNEVALERAFMSAGLSSRENRNRT